MGDRHVRAPSSRIGRARQRGSEWLESIAHWSTNWAVSRCDFAHNAGTPAASTVATAASTARRPSTGGVPVR